MQGVVRLRIAYSAEPFLWHDYKELCTPLIQLKSLIKYHYIYEKALAMFSVEGIENNTLQNLYFT